MNSHEAKKYLENYFHKLYVDHDVDYLEEALDPQYWDDDIGAENENHIENSKTYLRKMFAADPSINVIVGETTIKENVISSFLEWTAE